jgi:hypothetical protein
MNGLIRRGERGFVMARNIGRTTLAFVVSACLILTIPCAASGLSPGVGDSSTTVSTVGIPSASDAIATEVARSDTSDSSVSLTPLAATKKVSGKGVRKSKSVTLTKGVWAVSYVFTRNRDICGAKNFIAELDGKRLRRAMEVASLIAINGKGRHNLFIATTSRYWIDVTHADPGANWSMIFTKVGMSKAKRFSGVGAMDTKRFKLVAGKTYTFTIRYSGNRDDYKRILDFFVTLRNNDGSLNQWLLEGQKKESLTVKKRIKVERTGYYWLDIYLTLPSIKWAISYR